METKINKRPFAGWLVWSLVGLGLILIAIVAFASPYSIEGAVTTSFDEITKTNFSTEVMPKDSKSIFIVNTFPLNFAEDQDILNNIIITFSESMDIETVNQYTFMVKGSNEELIEGLITSDAIKKVFIFNPLDELDFNTQYTITITTGVKGLSGNVLTKNFLMSFTTKYNSGGSSGGGSGSSGGGGGSSDGGTGGDTNPPAESLILTTILLTPTSANVSVGSTKQLNATGMDQNGNIIVTTINYSSSNLTVASVSSTGMVNALAIGTTTITARNGTINDTSIIEVTEIVSESCPLVNVNLGTAGDFVILTKTGISTTGTTSIVGDLGVSPIDSTAITGFGLIADPSNTFSTSSLVTGKVYAADYTSPTPTVLTTAIGDLELAYDTANGLSACFNEVGAGNIGGLTLSSGVYKWSTSVIIPTDVTISGNSTDVWVFQIAGTLDLASATQVKLIGGAQAKNIFWVVADTTTLGTTSVFNGNILDQTNINLLTGATLNGRALAKTAVTLDSNDITKSI